MALIKECILKLSKRGQKKRLYFEGTRLDSIGMHPGTRFNLIYNDDSKTLEIVISESGAFQTTHKFKGEKEIPAIDLSNLQLTEFFDGIDHIRARFQHGKIVVSLTRNDMRCKERFDRLINKLKNNETLDVGSVAHGGGVLDLALHTGLKMAGVSSRLAFGVEMEKKYLEASLANNPVWDDNSLAYECPMQEVDVRELPQVDFFAGGIPCTGASKTGKLANKLANAESHETAGTLFLSFLNFIEACNPSLVLLENVPEYGSTVSMQVITQVLSDWGYEIHERVLDGTELGSLERRKRLCMVAVTKGLSFDFEQLGTIREKEESLGDVLENIGPDDERFRVYPYLIEGEKKNIAAGRGFRIRRCTPETEWVHTLGRGYNNVRIHEGKLQHPTDPDKMRQFTPVEHARIKTIPERLIAGLPKTTAHEILGQSVIFSAFVAVGRLIGQVIKGGRANSAQMTQPAIAVGVRGVATQLVLGF